jgi:hypothetical protein
VTSPRVNPAEQSFEFADDFVGFGDAEAGVRLYA